jgi:hypothetical protein
MSAPRIDTFRRTMDAVVERLAELRPDIEDVHDLAYNRTKAAAYDRVNGGDRDYALDTHGDMIARDLYIDVAAQLVGLGRGVERAAKKLRAHLNQQSSAIRRDGSADVTAAEFTQARYAQARRIDRGEQHAHAVVAQAERRHFIDPVAELEQLRTAVRRLSARMDQEHKDCRYHEGERAGKRRPRWLDRSILSPAQRTAIDRALLIEPDEAAAS